MTNCFHLNLQINPLREGIFVNSYGTAEYTRLALTDINHDLISFLSTLNLTIRSAAIFYTAPFSFTGIHVDLGGQVIVGDYTKLNYVFGGKNSVMCWWKKKDNISNILTKTLPNRSYISFSVDQVDLIDKQQVNFPSIVQVGVPHNIENFEEPRYCISLALEKHCGTRLTMAESIEIFKDYL
jgi:hypothetical protein